MNVTNPLPDGYTWAGNLDDTDIRSLYAACHSLRFSGRLQLADGGQKAEVMFVAGEPVEIDGGDTQRIALWSKGTFRAIQSIPSLSGELTSAREMRGSLGETKPSQLWAWISEYRLTCEVELERPGNKAVVTFSNGHAENALVNGAPELAALARVSSWTDGTFHVRLKPLFVDGVIPVAPPMPEGAPPMDPRQFDVSRSIPMDLKHKPSTPHPPPVVTRLPTPPLGELAMKEAEFAPSPSQDRSQATMPLPPHAVKMPPLRGKDRPATQELSSGDLMPLKKGGGKGIWILTIILVLAAGGAGALYYFHLPPFSPPPKPIVDETKPPAEETKPPAEETKPPVEAQKPPTEEAKPPVEAQKPPTEEAKPPVEAQKPPVPSEEEKPLGAKAKANQDKAEKLIARGRLLLVEGHEHTAMDDFKKAEKYAVGKLAVALRNYEQQALGKLGRAELLIEGKAPVTVNGHKFNPPRKVKVPAGPLAIDLGDGEKEVELKRGEKRKLKGKK